MNRSIQFKKAIPLIVVALACFTLLPGSRAVSPAPDGGYPLENTAEGQDALFSLTTGRLNTAIGFNALFRNTTGRFNTATGASALRRNTRGDANTATGVEALLFNTTGEENTATGFGALALNTTGNLNTAAGAGSLGSNTTGSDNTATGLAALALNTTGLDNTAMGFQTLFFNTSGNSNTATGAFALSSNATGGENTADGLNALRNNTTGRNNIALGFEAGANLNTGDNNIDIGNQGVRDESNTIRIGTVGTQTKTFIAGIRDAVIEGVEVRVNQKGRLGTVPSSKRFKELIKPMNKASEVLLALRPVTFHYKAEIDLEGIPQFGLVAEDVERVNPDLVVHDRHGKPYTVRYDAVNAMLLNEFLKEHRKVEEQGAMIAHQPIRLKSNRQNSPCMLTLVVVKPKHTQDFSSSSGDFCSPCEAKNSEQQNHQKTRI
jgi:hypothetical protein